MPDAAGGTRPATASERLTADVVVVGGGPAGAAAAVHAARRGLEAVLVDKAAFPRDKCCGDGLTTLALRELELLGFRPDAVDDWFEVDAAWLRSPSGREVTVPLPRDGGVYAAVAPRRQLDAALLAIAEAHGVTIRTGPGAAFGGIDADGPRRAAGGRVVTLADGTRIAAGHVVAADGMWSPVRKALGLGTARYLGEWNAFRQYVADVSGPAAERLYVWFDADLLPGYAWSFPLPGGRANVGFGVLRADDRPGREVKALWDGLIERPHIRHAMGRSARLEGRHLAWPIPGRIDVAVLEQGDVLFVGDAAAASDVLTGEGIGQALLTGRAAAEAIAAAGGASLDGSAATAGAHYAEAVRAELFADHKMSAALGRVLRHRRGADGALSIVGRSGEWGRRNFARWMFEDEPRSIVLTPRRWHRRILSRPGPFAGSHTADAADNDSGSGSGSGSGSDGDSHAGVIA